MEYVFLVDTYDTERIKTLSVWSMFTDDDLLIRPQPLDRRDRTPLEHMVHQCMSEDKWFCNMFGLPQNDALTIYAYPDIKSLIEGEAKGGLKAPLPGPGNKPSTERPDL